MYATTSERLDKMVSEMDSTIQYLVRESLAVLLPATLIVAWIWTAFIVLVEPAYTVAVYLTFAVLALSAMICFWQRNRSAGRATGAYLFGLILACAILMFAVPYPAVYYVSLSVVLVTAMLTNTRTTWGVTALLLALIWITGAHRGMAWPLLLSPSFMLLFTALTSWLSSQRLVTALEWAMTMSRQGQRKAEEARAHRADLQRVMQSLDLAYARLERANQRLIFAQEAAEQAYRFKADFVANVSHELRTPLNLIVGFGEMMATAPESYGGVMLPREYRGDVMAVYRNARHLLEMINDVLDLSQIEAGRMVVDKERLDLREVIEEAVAMVRGLADARGLDGQSMRSAPKLRTPLPAQDGQPVVLVLHEDWRTLKVLRRHIPGCLFVLATTPEEATSQVHQTLPNLILVDTRWQEQWPDEVHRLADETAIPWLTCPLPSMHHLGQLMGATDYLPKPVMRSDLAEALARLSKPPQTALVIDDDPHVVRLIVRTLKAIRPELRVWEAFGGEEGLEAAFSQRPDIIFLDLVMPEVSGYSVIDAVLREPDLAQTDIIVVSVRSMEQELAPVAGDLRLQHGQGFSLTELLHVLQSMLAVLTQPGAVSPASAAAPLEILTG